MARIDSSCNSSKQKTFSFFVTRFKKYFEGKNKPGIDCAFITRVHGTDMNTWVQPDGDVVPGVVNGQVPQHHQAPCQVARAHLGSFLQ